MPSPSISRAASSKKTSVKTAIEKGGRPRASERQDVPDALAGGAARIVPAFGGQLARPVADDDLVVGRAVLGMHRRLDQLAAHPQLLDDRAAVVDDRALDHRLLRIPGRRLDPRGRRSGSGGRGRTCGRVRGLRGGADDDQQCGGDTDPRQGFHAGILGPGCAGPSITIARMVDRTLLLVDGSSYLYRAYHALPDLRGPGGVPTGAIRGVVSMMKLLREQYPAAHGACVFDDKGKTFRDDWYPEYKATRTAMPSDLALQIEPIVEAVKLLGWPVLTVPGIEADDAIGTISCMAAKGGFKVVISTGDKDLAQLVNDSVTLINTMSNETLDVAGVSAKFGVPPERIVDYLALIGDSVDNIPGVDKVGPKTAVKWLAEHGSLEGVIAAAPSIKGVVGDNLRKALDWLPRGRRLVTVATDCDLTGHVLGWPEFDGLALGPIDVAGMLAFYDRYGFASMRKELEAANGRSGPAAAVAVRADSTLDVPDSVPSEAIVRNYQTLTTHEALDTWLRRIEAAPIVALTID